MGKKITAQAIGGEAIVHDRICTVGELKKEMGLTGYTATVNGEVRDDNYQLPDYAFVSLAAPVKGGAR